MEQRRRRFARTLTWIGGVTALFCVATTPACTLQPSLDSAPVAHSQTDESPSLDTAPLEAHGATSTSVTSGSHERESSSVADDAEAESTTADSASRGADPSNATASEARRAVEETRVTAPDPAGDSSTEEALALIEESSALLASVDLSAIADEQKSRAELLRTLLLDAREAVKAGDTTGGRKLAEKAILIARDLAEVKEGSKDGPEDEHPEDGNAPEETESGEASADEQSRPGIGRNI